MTSISGLIFGPIEDIFSSSITSILKALVPALTNSTSVFTSSVYSTWQIVLAISESFLGIALVAVAYSYFTGIPIMGRRADPQIISKLVVATVLMPFTLYFAQLILDVNDAMTAAVLPYSELGHYSSSVVAKLGGFSPLIIILLSLITLLLYLVLVLRTMLVFFLSSLLPLLALCGVFELTRSFSRKLISLLVEMIFLPFFMAVALRIGIMTSSSSFTSFQIPQLVIAGTYLLPLLVPMIISPGGQRVMQLAGMPSLAPALAFAGVAAAGAGGYAAGLISYPVRSYLLPGRTVEGNKEGKYRWRGRYGVNPAAAFDAGSRHSSMLMERATNISMRLPLHRHPFISSRYRRRYISRSIPWERMASRPHRIYMGEERDE